MNTDKDRLMKRLIFILIVVFAVSSAISAQTAKRGARVLLVPLDDRPPTLQFAVRMGEIGDAEVVAPPKNLLGRFTEFGKSDEIVEWIARQDLKRFDAVIVALDMLAYGGLVASRVHGETTAADALRRLEALREIKKHAPKTPVYAQSVIMRLAPTGTGENESYREKLSRWADVSPYSDAASKAETARLEREIPPAALADYKRARARNLQVNLKAIEMVGDKTIDYLILSQDDAKPKGIHVADRERLIAEIKRRDLAEKIAVQPGADEVAMLLLARALNERFRYSPRVKAVYSSEETANKAMPFEDRALRETVSFHIKATGAREVENERDADVFFYVFASRFESGRAESFAAEIESKVKQNKKVIVADIDPRGDVQGGDTTFTEALARRRIFPELNGYASWNTAGNTIGTALPQGVIFALAQARLMRSPETARRIWTAQNWFTFHRVVDDYYYHNLVRAQAKNFIAQNKWSSIRLTDEATAKVEAFSRQPLGEAFARLGQNYFGAPGAGRQKNVRCEKPTDFTFDLPWNRTFEAEIDFDLRCSVTAEK